MDGASAMLLVRWVHGSGPKHGMMKEAGDKGSLTHFLTALDKLIWKSNTVAQRSSMSVYASDMWFEDPMPVEGADEVLLHVDCSNQTIDVGLLRK